MSVISLLSKLKKSGIRVQLVDDKLKLNAPKGTLTPDLLNELKQQREQVIEFLRSTRKESDYTPIEPMEKREYYELSSAQKRLYLIHQMIPDTTAYNIPMNVPLINDPDLDSIKERLTCVFKQLIVRHESFRTSFEMVDGQPVQRIHDGVEFEIEYYSGERRAEGFTRPFDLSKAPLLRAGVVNSGDANRILMVDMHHIVSDGTSQDILRREFAALDTGKELPPMRLQYKDYSEWQNSSQQKEQVKKQQRYWLKEFSYNDELPVLNLPTDYPRPLMQRFAGVWVRFELNVKETKILKKIAEENDVTLYMILLAAFNVLFSKLSGQEDIILGTPIVARRHTDLQYVIGMLVNTLAMRNYPSGDKTFREFLKEVKQRTLKAYENQEYPFEELVENITVNRDTSRNPVFDVLLNLLNQMDFQRTLDKSQREIKEEHVGQHRQATSRFDLAVSAVDLEERILLELEYSTKLFRPFTIERFIKYLKNIVLLLPENQDRSIADIEMITVEEKKAILEMSKGVEELCDVGKTIHQLFEEQAARSCNGTAVVCVERRAESIEQDVGAQGAVPLPWDHVSLTYKELNQKSNQLAHFLREKGVGPDSVVGIMVERSIELIIGIMGILKAGGAYLPIDLNYPQERIDYMLKESGVEILLTDNSSYPSCSLCSSCFTLAPEALLNLPEGRLIHHSSFITHHSGNLAYIIYTSGTTGMPKGAAVEHRSLVNASNWHRTYYRITETDIVSQYASIVFDASVVEIFPCLIGGGVLHIIPGELKLELDRLNTYLEKNHITVCFLPTQVCEQFLERENHSLRVLFTGGDKLRVFRKKTYQLHNNYGPTENTVVATVYQVEEQSHNIPIGKPVYNNQVYILSIDRMHLQPIGVVGELCIAGDNLSRGYLNNPELTAKKFIDPSEQASLFPTPYSPTHPLTHSTIYRTGDLARWLANGNVEFLGRWDNQVKTRGYRIELGEIEYHLKMHPEIKEVVVVNVSLGINKNDRGKQCLCAYFVSRQSSTEGEGEKKPSITNLKKYLAKKLLDYMIPAYFVQMDNIPLTVNGKVDRKMLPQPREIESQTDSFYVAPETGMQQIIAETWKEVLGQDKVGIRDNFFDLGGNSLDFIMVSNKLQEKLKREIPVVTLFTHPTIGSLEEYLGRDEGNKAFEDRESQSDCSELVDEGKNLMQQTLRKLDEED